ncbi:3-dehydroquinate synthase family protein [Klebsormidium nitens]|uniref:3-dehydroquinate synthase family protein n=1 Tax=Klebsormidium nitens TaxID=105231 RepID=A0A1Y1HZM6_KLENI|nr:3-dehydroquinate synthase family protein [Klebsormidium nitens]|eukprot:GAQ82381.1 3-dehydroquinate synthase family protein [Klebsormidium nitens]
MSATASACRKAVWIWTQSKQVFTAATEAGFNHLVFTGSDEDQQLAKTWQGLASFKALYCLGGELRSDVGSLEAVLHPIANPGELDAVIAAVPTIAFLGSTTIVEFVDWKVIPAENLVAAFDGHPGRLFAVADGAQDAIVSFEALERGTDGVVLRTENPADVFAIKEYVDRRAGGASVPLVYGHVTRVEPVGMGDRACVDLCSLLKPGEGMLVGSFARALFLVHSECLESNYVASRPFRVNAGPVHSYVAAPGGKTAYLSELQSGREVLVVDSQGLTRSALVGRVKIESRPLILVEAQADGQRHSILLQNAETVRLVGSAQSDDGGENERVPISVSKLKLGDRVLLSIQDSAARHTGFKVKEMIDER